MEWGDRPFFRTVSRRGVLFALALALVTLVGCGRGTTGDLSATENAVTTASARVVSVTESGWRVNGLGHTLFMTIRVNDTKPMSADDLDSIIKAIWVNAPGEPNTIELMAFADAAEEKPVDLRTAAAKLPPTISHNSGEAGIALIATWKRYGKWKNPS